MRKRTHKKSANRNTKNGKNPRQSKLRIAFGGGIAVLVFALMLTAVLALGGNNGGELYETSVFANYDITHNSDLAGASDLYAAKTILLHFNDFESREEARHFANGIYQRALAGEDFDWLISRYANQFTNPDGYTFTRGGSMIDKFEDAVAALEIGGIGLAETDFGIYIIQRIQPN